MIKRSICMLLSAMMTATMISAPILTVMPGVNVRADEKKIEDTFKSENLQNWVKENVDTDKNGYLSQSEIEAVTSIRIIRETLTDISGLEIFTNMTRLTLYYTGISKFDTSLFPQLTYLDLEGNSIESLIVSKMPNLEELDCDKNKLEVLNVSKSKKLKTVRAEHNNLMYFYAGNNPSIECVYLRDNDLDEVNVEGLSNLEILYVDDNELKYLDVSNNSKLRYLDCNNTGLKELDLSKNPELHELECVGNPIGSLDTSNLKKLRTLAWSGQLANLDFKNNQELFCLEYSNFSGPLDLSDMPNLGIVIIGEADLDKLVLDNDPKLYELFIKQCSLPELDLKDCKDLKTLICINSNLSSINVSSNDKLKYFDCAGNKLTSIDVSSNKELEALVCNENDLTSLDISKNEKIKTLDIRDNKIKRLEIFNNPRMINAYNGIEKEPKRFYMANNGYWYAGNGRGSYDYWEAIFDGFRCDEDTEIITTAPSAQPTSPSVPSTTGGFEDFVERLYVVALGRASEKDGKDYWCELVGNGTLSGADCARFFLTSQEFKDRGLSDEDFLKVLYSTFFDRKAADDPDGFNFWMNSLKSVGKDTVVEGFINSPEWCNICADYGVRSGAPTAKATKASKNATGFATRLYTECLGREPEEGGLKYWSLGLTNCELTGSQAAHEFFYCQEFNDHNFDNKELITRMYKTFMGREPDTDGLNYWLDGMSEGMTKDQVFNSFVQSQEFTEICASYAINRA